MTHCVAVFDAQFTEEKVAKEMEYFMRSSEKSYERTYGWAWLLKLQDGASIEGSRRFHDHREGSSPASNCRRDCEIFANPR